MSWIAEQGYRGDGMIENLGYRGQGEGAVLGGEGAVLGGEGAVLGGEGMMRRHRRTASRVARPHYGKVHHSRVMAHQMGGMALGGMALGGMVLGGAKKKGDVALIKRTIKELRELAKKHKIVFPVGTKKVEMVAVLQGKRTPKKSVAKVPKTKKHQKIKVDFLTVAELKQICRDNNIKGFSKLNKAGLQKLVKKHL